MIVLVWVVSGTVAGLLLGGQLRRDTGYVTGMDLFLIAVFSMLGPLAFGAAILIELAERFGDRQFFKKRNNKS